MTKLLAAALAFHFLGAAAGAEDVSPAALLARSVPKPVNVEIKLLHPLPLGDRTLDGSITREEARTLALSPSCKDVNFGKPPTLSKAKAGSPQAKKEIAANLKVGTCWALAQLKRAATPTSGLFSADLVELHDPANLPQSVLPRRQYQDEVRAEEKSGSLRFTSFSPKDPKRAGAQVLLQPVARTALTGDRAEELLVLRTSRAPGASYAECELDILRKLSRTNARMDLTLRRRLGRCE